MPRPTNAQLAAKLQVAEREIAQLRQQLAQPARPAAAAARNAVPAAVGRQGPAVALKDLIQALTVYDGTGDVSALIENPDSRITALRMRTAEAAQSCVLQLRDAHYDECKEKLLAAFDRFANLSPFARVQQVTQLEAEPAQLYFIRLRETTAIAGFDLDDEATNARIVDHVISGGGLRKELASHILAKLLAKEKTTADVNLEDVQRWAVAHELEISTRSGAILNSSNTAAASSESSNQRGRSYRGRSARGRSRGGQRPSGTSKSRGKTCSHCGRRGHAIDECWFVKDRDKDDEDE
jgi:hypothetical protein